MAPLRIPCRRTILHCGDTPSLVAGVTSPPLGHRPALAVLDFEVGENRRENIGVVPKPRGRRDLAGRWSPGSAARAPPSARRAWV